MGAQQPGVWGSRFPHPIILPKDIDGGKHWGGTQEPSDGSGEAVSHDCYT